MKRLICVILLWASGLLAIALAGLSIRSYWRCDEIGYYTYDAAHGDHGRDCRLIAGSWRGGCFLMRTRDDLGPYGIDMLSGEPTEVLARSSPTPLLSALALNWPEKRAPAPVWRRGGFDVRLSGGSLPYPWRCAIVVVPDWALLAMLVCPPAIFFRRRRLRRAQIGRGLCAWCGYDLRASGPVCSECGKPRVAPGPGGGRRSA